MPQDKSSHQSDRSETDMRTVTLPVELFEEQHGKVFVSLKYPKTLGNAEVMENVLGIAMQELQKHPEIIEKFVETRTNFHIKLSENLKQLQLNEQNLEMQRRLEVEKTKRWGIVLSSCLVALALISILFYPEGRENLVYPIAAALIVCAAGAFGYTRVKWKAHGLEGSVERD